MHKRQHSEKRHSTPVAIMLRCGIYLLLFPSICLIAAVIRYRSTSPTALIPIISLVSLLITGFLGSIIAFGSLKQNTVAENLSSVLISSAIYMILSAAISGAISTKIIMNALCFVLISLFGGLLSKSVTGKASRRRHRVRTR